MTRRRVLAAFGVFGAAAALTLAIFAGPIGAQRPETSTGAAEARAALDAALAARRAAESRRATLEQRAAEARDAAGKAAQESAVLAARVQESEAGIAAAEARLALAARGRALLQEKLGQEQRPAVRLAAALQKFARRPAALAVLRPGSVRDVVYVRAMLEGSMPQLRARTAGLRGQLAHSRRLREEALAAAAALKVERGVWEERRAELAHLEQRERLAAREASSTALREAERALRLGEEARDLDGLLAEMDRTARLRERLARLSGPVPRPAQPGLARAAPAAGPVAMPAAPSRAAAPPAPYLLPVIGRIVTGFGSRTEGGVSNGITFATRPTAQVVAPASGRIIFAGPYRGYGEIVILEHPGGWISLVTGLARVDAAVGRTVAAGAPLGIAAAADPAITLELRNNGQAVNPLPFVG